ncbi:Sterol 3-beta-glucosyltransferase [Elasticomyces elasticus]|nr:Sterol 3-beta-glucosyltransferase [Elasticomyces elasticus]
MPPEDGSRDRLRRKLTKKRREPGRISIDIPERFRDDNDPQDDGTSTRDPGAFMHQSVLGMIAAAQSKPDFHARFEESSSESESEDGQKSKDTGATGTTALAKQHADASLDEKHVKHKKKLSDLKLFRSVPGFGLKPIRERRSDRDHMSESQILPEQSPRISVNRAESPPRHDAPVMSQMLQARARVDLESSDGSRDPQKNRGEEQLTSVEKVQAPIALANALMEIFQLEQPEEVIAEYPCWFLQSVLLSGYMYITQRHICFYAYLRKKNNVVAKSGYLSKRGKSSLRYSRYWFTLKGDVLSYFSNPAEVYFPAGNIDLRYGISAELIHDKDKAKDTTAFSVVTNKRTYHFRADSAPSAKEWVKQLQKVMFRSHNDGDSVKISLPTENVIDVEETSALDFAETVKIRVIDNDETYAIDEYYFSFFSFAKDALNVLKIMTEDSNARRRLTKAESNANPSSFITHQTSSTPLASVVHENVRNTLMPPPSTAESSPRPSSDSKRSSFDLSRGSIDKPRSSFDRGRHSASAVSRVRFTTSRRTSRSPLSTPPQDSSDSLSMAERAPDPSRSTPRESAHDLDTSASQILSGSAVFDAPTLRRQQPRGAAMGTLAEPPRHQSQDIARSANQDRIHIQPPNRAQTEQSLTDRPRPHRTATAEPAYLQDTKREDRRGSADSSALDGLKKVGTYPFKQASGFAGYIKNYGKRMGSTLSSSPLEYYGKVQGMLVGGKRHYNETEGLDADDKVRDPDEDLELYEHEMRFREHFGLSESERLVATFFASLHRVLPLYGKIYIGTKNFCFRSLLIGTRTKIVIPLKDIFNVHKEKGFTFGYGGMVVVIRGCEEIFFEFRPSGLRDDCTVTLLREIENAQSAEDSNSLGDEEQLNADAAAAENLLLQKARGGEHAIRLPRSVEQTEPDAPPILFDDPGASFVDFKPKKPLRITCLTIGSRGDVQPYIALCKGLLAEGHQPTIATHAEFEPWVRKHGIGFARVEGDPAELMRMCVANGMFTPAFLYEANATARGWLDGLLSTAWKACQDADLLIESPSAMAGIHIAEALGIPYFRAFTMPWTRTRAYPHAFSSSSHKGGAFNYMTYVFYDNLFWQFTAGQINKWRRKQLHLAPTSLDKLQANKVPFLYNFSPSVVVPPLDFSDWIRITGYWFLDEATGWTPPQNLVDFINQAREDGQKLVYIGFGSIVVGDSKLVTQQVVDAVKKADVRCILSKGWSDRLDKKDATIPEVPLPPTIFQINAAPHDWLFKQIDAAVHHGGAGTTGASLREGVPTIIKPFFGDQFFFANRVEDLGVGIKLHKLGENALGKALWIACHDERMREKAKVLGENIRQENGVETAIKAIYRDMEYAKTLIKRRNVHQDHETDDDAATEESWTFVENDSSDPEPLSPRRVGENRRESVAFDQGQGRSRRSSAALGSVVLKKS